MRAIVITAAAIAALSLAACTKPADKAADAANADDTAAAAGAAAEKAGDAAKAAGDKAKAASK